ncbi:MAG TPA: PEGA domain-containing protein, partial [Magnetospirillaceae bacterium]|nr:PEGA domain-containing protein [Magnetospirillaceae bacterium]
GRADFSHTVYTSKDDAASAAEELAQAVIRAAAARPSARLVFDVEPPDAEIRVDGQRLAAGRRSLRVYEERDHLVSVEAWKERREYSMRPIFGMDVHLTVRLEEPAGPALAIETDPPGASLYLDGMWAGHTPLEVSAGHDRLVAVVTLTGYEQEFFTIDPAWPARVDLSLRPAKPGIEPLIERRREDFHRALGYLVISLPVSTLASGAWLQSSALLQQYPGNPAIARRSVANFAAFAVTGGITAATLVNAAIRLARYIRSVR